LCRGSANTEIIRDIVQGRRYHTSRHDRYELPKREDCSDEDLAISGPVVGIRGVGWGGPSALHMSEGRLECRFSRNTYTVLESDLLQNIFGKVVLIHALFDLRHVLFGYATR
jgi:hypothetical protein